MTRSVEDALVLRLEASLRQFERQMASAQKTAERSTTGIQRRFDGASKQIETSATRASTSILRMTQMSGRGRFVLQNTANQIGDIAVQMQAGTSAGRAMGQQLPQLFGGFGALGGALGILGPLMGTVAALGIPLAVALANVGEKAEGLDEQIKALSKAMSDLGSAQRLAGSSASDLVGQYGGLASEAQAVFEINRQMAAIRARTAMNDVTRGVAQGFGIGGAYILDPEDISDYLSGIEALRAKKRELEAELRPGPAFDDALPISKIEELNAELDRVEASLSALGGLSGQFDNLAKLLGISAEQAKEVAVRFAEVGKADGPRAQADAMTDLVGYIDQVSGNLSNAEEEGRTLYERLVSTSLQMLEMAKFDIANPFADAADEAGRLADNLLDALNREAALAAGYAVSDRDENGRVYSGRGRGPTPIERFESRFGYIEPPETTRKRGGGSSSSQGLGEAKRLFDSTRSEAEKYAFELERINELHRLFPEIITTEVRDRAIKALNESSSELKKTADTLENSMENMFASIVSGSASAKDAVATLLNELSRMLAHSAFKQIDLGGFLGSIGIPGFATGTTYAPGGLAMVGERGPELVNLPRGSQVIPNSRIGKMGGDTIQFAPVINMPGADSAAVARMEEAMARISAEFESRVVSAVTNAKKRRLLK